MPEIHPEVIEQASRYAYERVMGGVLPWDELFESFREMQREETRASAPVIDIEARINEMELLLNRIILKNYQVVDILKDIAERLVNLDTEKEALAGQQP